VILGNLLNLNTVKRKNLETVLLVMQNKLQQFEETEAKKSEAIKA